MEKVYVCHTTYHLLITIVKAMESNEKVNLVVHTLMPNYKYLVKRLKGIELFNNIIVFESDDTIYPLIGSGLLKKITDYRKRLKIIKSKYNLDFLYNKDIYIYNDYGVIGQYLQLSKIKYNLIEDGLDCYKNIHNHYSYAHQTKKDVLSMLKMGVYPFGMSRYVKKIEINDDKDIRLPISKKFTVVNRQDLFKKLTKEQVEIIVNVFVEKDGKLINIEGISTLIITQPLFRDNIVSSKERQINIYRDVIQNYGKGNIIIKPHPRDNISYEEYFPQAIVIKEAYIPLEIFNFMDNISIFRAVTLFSTSLTAIEFCKEKIYLGYDWTINHK